MAQPPGTRSEPVAAPEPQRAGWRRPDPLTLLVLVAIGLFAVLGVGAPLAGHGVFAGTDELMELAPYQGAGLDRAPVQNTYLDDTWDSGIPNTLLLAELLRSGEIPAWNPYAAAGSPLAAVPTTAALSPVTAPYYVLPAALAPGYVKLAEIVLAVTGCALFLRRLGMGRPAALTGGLAFATSAFLIAWTNWPQTRVAALVPLLFWALERLVQRRRVADAALVAPAVAALLLGGFPAVTGYALLLGAAYLLVRAVAEYREQCRRLAGVLAGAAAGVLGGAALSAVQLLPFAAFLANSYVSGRAQRPGDHLPVQSLITTIAPWALGGVRQDRPPGWYLGPNMIESLSYVGAAVLVLAVTAVAAPRTARGVLPKGVWTFLVVATLAGGAVVYGGGFALGLLQRLPMLFADNYVGRARSVLGFLVAALAAVGLEVLLRRTRRTGRARWSGFGFAVLAWAGAALLGGWLWRQARHTAVVTDQRSRDGINRLAHLDREVLHGLAFLAAALVCAGALYWAGNRDGGRRLARFGAAGGLALLITVQALTLAGPFWPRADRDSFYPVTATHAFLRDHLGHERYAGTWGAMGVGADTHLRLRALTGHTFVDARLGALVREVPGTAGLYPTLVNFAADPRTAASPVLDRLGTRYFVTAPQVEVFGLPRPPVTDGTAAVLRPDQPVTVPVPGVGPLRAAGVVPATPGILAAPGTPVAESTRLEVTVRGTDGRVVASNSRLGVIDRPFLVPLAAEHLAPDEQLTATLTLRADRPVPVAGRGGVPALAAVGGADDGLRIAHAGSAVVYQRLTALPRIRWATEPVVEPDPRRRLARLAGGDLKPDQVLLDAPGPATSGPSSGDPGRAGSGGAGSGGAGSGSGNGGVPAQLDVRIDGPDEIVVDVDAAGTGYLVVADALQTGWAARVDGIPADLVPADHAVVAVPVPPGTHRVQLRYTGPQHGAGRAISGVAGAALLGVLGAQWLRARRKPAAQ